MMATSFTFVPPLFCISNVKLTPSNQLRLPLREALCIKLPMRLVLVTSILMNACWQLESRQTTIRLAVLVANASCLVRNRRQL